MNERRFPVKAVPRRPLRPTKFLATFLISATAVTVARMILLAIFAAADSSCTTIITQVGYWSGERELSPLYGGTRLPQTGQKRSRFPRGRLRVSCFSV